MGIQLIQINNQYLIDTEKLTIVNQKISEKTDWIYKRKLIAEITLN